MRSIFYQNLTADGMGISLALDDFMEPDTRTNTINSAS